LKLTEKQEELVTLRKEMEAAAQKGDYAKALQLSKKLSAKTDAYLAAANKQVEPPILGSAQDERATAVLKKMSKADQQAVGKLMDDAKSEAEKSYIQKGVASGHSVKELQEFAKKIQGKDAKWMRNNLSLTGNSKGRGVEQQWSMSCNATAVEAVHGQMDPVYALKMHEDSPKLDKADDSDATKVNPKLAEDQRKMLTSSYKGKASTDKSGGVAVARGAAGGQGRWADDLLNNVSDSTGVSYTTKKLGGGTTVDDAIKSIDSGVSKGQPVPIIIGSGPTAYNHYVVVTGMEKGPPKSYTIHDPGSGKTVVRTEAQLKGGAINLSGWNQISAFEDPSTKKAK
jgi:hypothetical protein